MFKDFLVKQMLKKRGVPEAQIDGLLVIINKNPELFKNIAEEVQAEIKAGKDQMAATVEVMQRHQAELAKLKE